MIERFQHRVLLEVVAVLQAPLQLTDPDRDAREFGGIFVELNAKHIGRAGDHVDRALHADGFGFEIGL